MQAKNVLYAAVGAPVVAVRKVGDRVNTWKAKVNKETSGYTEAAEKTLNTWATEGEKVVSRISDGAVVEELSQKMDLDQAKEQVGKLRDQLEDMLDTWRHSFKPEEKPATTSGAETKPAAKATATASTKKSTAKKPAAKTTSPKKPAAKKPAAKKSAASTATKKAASKSSSTAKTSKAS